MFGSVEGWDLEAKQQQNQIFSAFTVHGPPETSQFVAFLPWKATSQAQHGEAGTELHVPVTVLFTHPLGRVQVPQKNL